MEEDAQHKETTAKRRMLDSEMEETEELRRKREVWFLKFKLLHHLSHYYFFPGGGEEGREDQKGTKGGE